jgi:hypothetical protein
VGRLFIPFLALRDELVKETRRAAQEYGVKKGLHGVTSSWAYYHESVFGGSHL